MPELGTYKPLTGDLTDSLMAAKDSSEAHRIKAGAHVAETWPATVEVGGVTYSLIDVRLDGNNLAITVSPSFTGQDGDQHTELRFNNPPLCVGDGTFYEADVTDEIGMASKVTQENLRVDPVAALMPDILARLAGK